jgi:hypothetical protein
MVILLSESERAKKMLNYELFWRGGGGLGGDLPQKWYNTYFQEREELSSSLR